MGFSLAEIWHSMGLVSRIVAGSILLMLIMTVGVTIERLVFLMRSNAQSRDFAPKASALMKTTDLGALTKEALRYPHSQLAKLLHIGAFKYVEYQQTEDEDHLSPLEATKRAMTRRAETLSAELRRGMSVLASIGSITPFVGLFGTVVGIINAFQGIAKSGSSGLGAVSAGISEALIMTAFGLAVAIPAVLLYNWLTGKIDATELDITNATGEFIDELERAYGPKRALSPNHRRRMGADHGDDHRASAQA